MKTFPLFLDLAGQPVLLIGGGEQAAQKARLILKTEARLRLVADDLNAELAAHVAAGRAERVRGPLVSAIAEARLVFVATGCAGADAGHAAVARSLGRFVNTVDRPELCDFLTPAIVDRDPVVVAIGTEGVAPVLARRIKAAVEAMLEPGLGAFATAAGGMRERVVRAVPAPRRRAFWDWAFQGPRRRFTGGDRSGALDDLERALAAGGAPASGLPGFVSLIGAGHGSADLVTLRAVERLQTADVVLHDRTVDPGVLELARRDAQRVATGPAPGAPAWRDERLDGAVLAAARRGLRVVLLHGADLDVRQAAKTLEAAGVDCEIVPGVQPLAEPKREHRLPDAAKAA